MIPTHIKTKARKLQRQGFVRKRIAEECGLTLSQLDHVLRVKRGPYKVKPKPKVSDETKRAAERLLEFAESKSDPAEREKFRKSVYSNFPEVLGEWE